MALLGEYHAMKVAHELTADELRIVEEFHKLYYRLLHSRRQHAPDLPADDRDSWLGHRILKCPMDLMTYQEILFDTKPDVIIETGTFHGGSALFLATMCELLGRGRVITIDLWPIPDVVLPKHDLIEYRYGYTQSAAVAEDVRATIKPSERVMVILDSDHRKDHVSKEIANFAPLVSQGCYLVVEDTNFGGHPVLPGFGLGPLDAVAEFMAGTDEFEIDRSREKQLLTFNPCGYLKRIKKTAVS